AGVHPRSLAGGHQHAAWSARWHRAPDAARLRRRVHRPSLWYLRRLSLLLRPDALALLLHRGLPDLSLLALPRHLLLDPAGGHRRRIPAQEPQAARRAVVCLAAGDGSDGAGWFYAALRLTRERPPAAAANRSYLRRDDRLVPLPADRGGGASGAARARSRRLRRHVPASLCAAGSEPGREPESERKLSFQGIPIGPEIHAEILDERNAAR